MWLYFFMLTLHVDTVDIVLTNEYAIHIPQ